MRTTAILCFVSAVLGSLFTQWIVSGPALTDSLSAQDAGYSAGPELRVPQQPRAAGQAMGQPSAPQTRFAPASIPAETVQPALYSPEEQVNIGVYENVNRSVVNISTKSSRQRYLMFELPPEEGNGSGSILDQRGHVLTNYHVVEGAQEVEVALYDGSSYPAQIVGGDPSTDIAVLKIDAPPELLHPVTLGDSTNLKVGQRVFAIGNPFGLERTLTTGVISSLNRSLPARNKRKIKQVIQIDAAINPGNSGGPLINRHSQLIGMNTAIASNTGANTGVGFAIPVNIIARVVPQLIQNGRVTRPDSGINQVMQTDRGLLIATLVPGGPAERAGLKGFRIIKQRKRQGPFVYEYETVDRSEADLIVGVNGEPCKTADDFLSLIEAHKPGEEVQLNVIRGDRQVSVPLVLGRGE